MAVIPSACATLTAETNEPYWAWRDVNMNGMGWVTGVVICAAAPHQMYAKTDVGGAYRYDRETETWVQMMDGFGYDERGSFSVESIAVDPNDGDIVYVAANQTSKNLGSEIWKSTDAGATWEATGLRDAKAVYMGGNDPYRSEAGERLTVDPNNSDVLYFGSRRDGLWRKLGDNGWAQADGLPVRTSGENSYGYTFVSFDKNGGTAELDGVTVSAVFYVGAYLAASDKPGIYKTTDGGKTFALMNDRNGTPLPLRGAVNANGVFVSTVEKMTDGNKSGVIVRGERGSNNLTEITSTKVEFTISGLAVGVDGGFVALASAVNDTDGVFASDAKGETWTRRKQENGVRIPYQDTDWCHPERGGFVIDFSDPSGETGFAGTGFGVVRTANLKTGAGSVIWDDHTAGISELCVAIVKTAPIVGGPDLQIACSDMGGFVVLDRDTVPASRLAERNVFGGGPRDWAKNDTWYGPEWGIPLSGINGFDYSYQNPNYMAYTGWHQFGWFADFALKFGTSKDGGKTWAEITVPAKNKAAIGLNEYESAGALAMSSQNPYNLVWSPVGGPLRYSTDFGESWQEAAIDKAVYGNNFGDMVSGANIPVMYERVMPFWTTTQNVQADKVNGDVFYLLTVRNSTVPEFYRSADGGRTWAKTYTGADNPTDFSKINAYWLPSVNIRVNPVREGDVFAVTPTWFDDDKSFIHRPLWRSTDASCTDFAVVEGVQSCLAVGFGAGVRADTPYIYIYGQANGDTDFAVYVSKDDGKSWLRITPPEKQYGAVCGIEGDMRYTDLVYVYFGGRGVVYGTGADFTGEYNGLYDGVWKD
jgi:hypothetical protein